VEIWSARCTTAVENWYFHMEINLTNDKLNWVCKCCEIDLNYKALLITTDRNWNVLMRQYVYECKRLKYKGAGRCVRSYQLNQWTTLPLTMCYKTPQDPVGVKVGVSSKKAGVLTKDVLYLGYEKKLLNYWKAKRTRIEKSINY
jgi:hypothetical protein